MTKWLAYAALLLVAPLSAVAQQPEAASPDAAEIEVYTRAVSELIGPPTEASGFFVAGRLSLEGGGLKSSHAPEAVVSALKTAGYDAALAELAENGLWQAPRRGLLLMLHEIDWWPGEKIARLRIDVGPREGPLKGVAFKFLNQDGEWTLIEKGPAESDA